MTLSSSFFKVIVFLKFRYWCKFQFNIVTFFILFLNILATNTMQIKTTTKKKKNVIKKQKKYPKKEQETTATIKKKQKNKRNI